MDFLKNPIISKNTVLILGDGIISFLSLYLGVSIRFYFFKSFQLSQYEPILFKALIFSISVILMCFIMDLYSVENGKGKKEIFLKILFAGIFTCMALAALYYFLPLVEIGRGILFIAVCVSVVLQFAWHMAYDFGLKIPGVAKRVLILGTGPIARTVGLLFDTTKSNLALAGYVNCLNEAVVVSQKYVIGNGDSLLSIALKEKVQQIVVSLTEKRGTFPVKEVLDCKLKGINVIDGPAFYEQMTGKLLVESINPSSIIFTDGFHTTIFKRYLKRVCDVFISLTGLIASSPFLIIVPILIRLDSKGPVLFRQERVGQGEKKFTLYKFRTMIDGAEDETGPVWTQENDVRITRLGKFLRISRLDEIPQLFNVLRGDMSFVGPRPERSFFVETLKKQIPYYSEKHCIKPGITGWAQVRYEYGDSVEDAVEKLGYDLYYIKHLSIFLDLLIILDTVKVIFFGRGGR
ncbi:MAG: TIGR03013 family XrtA/PEP-CTERM system glycosyltransferase [Nitrospirota bacterium]